MRRLFEFRSLFILAGLVFLFLTPAHADSGAADYVVNGQLTITGNNACGASPCSESLQFSFDFDYVQLYPAQNGNPAGYVGSAENPLLISASGPLGSFGSGGCCVTSGYLAMANGLGDEIDLETDLGSVFQQTNGTPGPPVFLGSDLYSCQSTICVNDFLPPGSPETGLFLSGTLNYTATLVPEPPTVLLVCFGLLGLGLLRAWRRKMLVRSLSV